MAYKSSGFLTLNIDNVKIQLNLLTLESQKNFTVHYIARLLSNIYI